MSAGSQTIAAPLMLASGANFAPAAGTQLILSGAITGTGGLSLTDAGTLILSGTNSYSGGTTVSAGTLQGTTASLQGSITNNAALVFNQATDGTYAGTISGTGTVGKSGSSATDVHVDQRHQRPDRGQPGHARSFPADWPAAVRLPFPAAPRCEQPGWSRGP